MLSKLTFTCNCYEVSLSPSSNAEFQGLWLNIKTQDRYAAEGQPNDASIELAPEDVQLLIAGLECHLEKLRRE